MGTDTINYEIVYCTMFCTSHGKYSKCSLENKTFVMKSAYSLQTFAYSKFQNYVKKQFVKFEYESSCQEFASQALLLSFPPACH